MNKPHKHAEIIKAWADGLRIQWRTEKGPGSGKWHDLVADYPEWRHNRKFRIKPEPQYPKTNMSDQELTKLWCDSDGQFVGGCLRIIVNAAIARAIEDEQVIIAPGQIEG